MPYTINTAKATILDGLGNSHKIDVFSGEVEQAQQEALAAVEAAKTSAISAVDAASNRATRLNNDTTATLDETANMIAEDFVETKAYPAGTYVRKEVTSGSTTVVKLYRLTSDYTANVGWDSVSKVEVKLGNDVSDLKSAVGFSVISLTQKSVYLTNTDPISSTPSTSTAFSTILIPCAPGDRFTINATGNNNAKPFAFVDDQFNVVYLSASNNVRSGIAVCPTGATKLIINNNNSKLISYYGVDPKIEQTKLENALTKPLFSVAHVTNAGLLHPGQANGTSYNALSSLIRADDGFILKSPSHRIKYFRYNKTSGEYVDNTGYWIQPPVNMFFPGDYDYRIAIPFDNGNISGCVEFCKNVYNYISIESSVGSETNGNTVDLMIFMGQSNMAGRGVTSETWPETAPMVDENAGYEFRAISDPTKLYPITEPFGVAENKQDAINDGAAKTGGMVSAFVNAYYKLTKVPVVAVSASEGSTPSYSWRHGSARLNDAMQRIADAITYLTINGYIIRHKYMVWCQGETDGSQGVTGETYKTRFDGILADMKSVGIEKCLLCRIGEYNGDDYDYTEIINAQTSIAQTNPDVVMITTVLASFKEAGLMKDQYHYYQTAYNIMGTYAGINAANYSNTSKEPSMYDPKSGNLYYSHKN